MTFRIAAVCIGLLAPLLFLELVLRVFPVNEGFSSLPMDDENPILRFAPNRTLTWSRGWNFSIVNTLKTNNYGFINDQDYEPGSAVPLLAVIGDSYVEAAMVPFAETVGGRLASAANPHRRVYTFASSGSPLSEYLAYSEYAQRNFQPDAMVFVVVGNDFDEALLKYQSGPGHRYVKTDQDSLVLQRVNFAVSWPRRVLRRSSLARYVFLNLEAGAIVQKFRRRRRAESERAEFVGNTSALATTERVADAQQAVDQFLGELPSRSGLDPSSILFVVDGLRPHLYDPEDLRAAQGSFVAILREYFISHARSHGYEIVDMHPRFLKVYQANQQRFEFPTDAHWNTAGHRLAAEAIMASQVFRSFAQSLE